MPAYCLDSSWMRPVFCLHTRVLITICCMQDKHKVTFYLPPELHRKLKISSAVSSEPMSVIAERALEFYLTHSAIVEEVEASQHGRVHQLHECPDCATPLVVRDGELVKVDQQPGVLDDLDDEELSVGSLDAARSSNRGQQGEEELVPC